MHLLRIFMKVPRTFPEVVGLTVNGQLVETCRWPKTKLKPECYLRLKIMHFAQPNLNQSKPAGSCAIQPNSQPIPAWQPPG